MSLCEFRFLTSYVPLGKSLNLIEEKKGIYDFHLNKEAVVARGWEMKSLFTKHCLGCVRSSGDLLYKNVNDLKSKQEKQVRVATDKNQTAITWTAG